MPTRATLSLGYATEIGCEAETFLTPGVVMRNRTWLLPRWIAIIAVVAAGCTEQSPPSSPDAKANRPSLNQPPVPKDKTAAKVKKPKVIGNMTGPTQLVD